DLLGDPAVLDPHDRGAAKAHLATGCGRQGAHQEVVEGRAGMGSAADPAADHIVALGDQVGRPGKAEIGESRAEVPDEGPYVLAPAPRRVQRILQQHVGCGELVDRLGIQGIPPELGDPAPDDGLVFLFLGHWKIPPAFLSRAPCAREPVYDGNACGNYPRTAVELVFESDHSTITPQAMRSPALPV